MTRLETNFKRLLNRCETMASSNDDMDWRLEKYVGALQQLLSDLRKETSRPAQDVLTEYKRRVEFLQGITEAEKMVNPCEKVLAAEMLAPASKSSENSQPSRELHLQKKALYQHELRQELLGTKKPADQSEGDGVRQRQVTDNAERDLDTVIKHHNQQQERLAEEMLSLAHNLKNNATVANRIIVDDNKKLADTTRLADTNFGKLKTESERLEVHVKKSCNWWIWIMLVLVGITFIWIVLFMKMFPKR